MSAPRRLPVIRIPEPCSESWDAMPGDERTRFCDHCQHEVVNLEALTENEVAARLAAPGRTCVRMTPTVDGTPVTRTSQQRDLLSLLRELAAQKESAR